MKKYLLNAFAIALAIALSAFKSYAPYLTFAPYSLEATTVLEPTSYYSSEPMFCYGGSGTPCKIDISGYLDKAAFLHHLSTLSTEDALFEVRDRAIAYKN